MDAKDVMTTNVVTVRSHTPVEEIAKLLVKNRVSAVPVIREGVDVIGIVSEDDLIHREELGNERRPSWWLSLFAVGQEKAAAFVKSQGRIAADVMTRDVIVVEPETSLKEIAKILETRHIKRVPVVSNGELVGIVSRANLLQALAMGKDDDTRTVDDESIRRSIIDVLRTKAGLSGQNINVTVSEKNVHLWGIVFSEEERRAAVIAAESARGVKQIEDNLKIIDMPENIPWV